MQCARAIPVTWLGSGSCQARPSRLNINDDEFILLKWSTIGPLYTATQLPHWQIAVRYMAVVSSRKHIWSKEAQRLILHILGQDTVYWWAVNVAAKFWIKGQGILWPPRPLSALKNDSTPVFLNRQTAGPRPDTGPWHQLYRAARGSAGICHFSFLSNFHE